MPREHRKVVALRAHLLSGNTFREKRQPTRNEVKIYISLLSGLVGLGKITIGTAGETTEPQD